MLEAGADVVDVGGQSTRPGAAIVSAAEETERVASVIECVLIAPATVCRATTCLWHMHATCSQPARAEATVYVTADTVVQEHREDAWDNSVSRHILC